MAYILKNQSTGEILRGHRPPRVPPLHFSNIDHFENGHFLIGFRLKSVRFKYLALVEILKGRTDRTLFDLFYYPLFFIAERNLRWSNNIEENRLKSVRSVRLQVRGRSKRQELSRSLLMR